MEPRAAGDWRGADCAARRPGQGAVRYNVRNLQVRWLTTLLTGLAFFAVIALLAVMLAFVNGMYKLTLGSGQPGNVMVLAEGSTDESFSNVQIADAGDIELLPGVMHDDQDRPRRQPRDVCRRQSASASPAARQAAGAALRKFAAWKMQSCRVAYTG